MVTRKQESLEPTLTTKALQYFSLSIVLIIIEYCAFLVVNLYLWGDANYLRDPSENFIPVYDLIGTRVPLAFMLNNLFACLSGSRIWGITILHLGLSIICFLIPSYIIYKKTGKEFLIIAYCILYMMNVLFQREIIAYYDTSLFCVEMCAFVFVACSNVTICKRYVLLGIIGGFAWCTRPTGIVYIPIIIALACWETEVNVIKIIAVSLLAYIITISPFQYMIYEKYGYFSISAHVGSGTNEYLKCNNPFAYEGYPYLDLDHIDYVSYYTERGYSQSDIKQVPIEFAKSEPFKFMWFQMKKVLCFFVPIHVPLGSGDPVCSEKGLIITNHEWLSFQSKTFLLQCLLGIVNVYFIIYLMFGKHDKLWIIIFTVFVFYLVVHVITCVETRFKAVFDPILYASAILAFDQIHFRSKWKTIMKLEGN